MSCLTYEQVNWLLDAHHAAKLSDLQFQYKFTNVSSEGINIWIKRPGSNWLYVKWLLNSSIQEILERSEDGGFFSLIRGGEICFSRKDQKFFTYIPPQIQKKEVISYTEEKIPARADIL